MVRAEQSLIRIPGKGTMIRTAPVMSIPGNSGVKNRCGKLDIVLFLQYKKQF
jgi:hypothetical protein